MYLNRKGQSILENVVTVTLVALGIILSWDLSSQLLGGGIKNLVSFLEERNPHKYIQQSGGTGIGIPGCDCTNWIPPLSQPGTCNNPSCGTLEAAHTRVCLPSGCENTVFPPIETLRCLNDNPACCGNIQNVVNPPSGCGVNAVCQPNSSIPGCNPADGRCNDGTLLQRQECQSPGNWIYSCNGNAACQFGCTGTQPQFSTPCPGDQVRLQGNTPWSLPGSNTCSPNNNPPYYQPKCQVTCNSPYQPNGNQCVLNDPLVVVNDVCHCGPKVGNLAPPLDNARWSAATCPVGYNLIGGWCDYVDNNNNPVGGANHLRSTQLTTNTRTWDCRGNIPGISQAACSSTGCNTNRKLRSVAHCWPIGRNTPVYPQIRARGSGCSYRPGTYIPCSSCGSNPWCIAGFSWPRWGTHQWHSFNPSQCVGDCPANVARIIDIQGSVLSINGNGMTFTVRPNSSPNPTCWAGSLWFTVQGPGYRLNFCWRNSSTYGVVNPPVCWGSIVPPNAPTPACSSPNFPLISLLSTPSGWPFTYTSGDLKMVVCCDFTQQASGSF